MDCSGEDWPDDNKRRARQRWRAWNSSAACAAAGSVERKAVFMAATAEVTVKPINQKTISVKIRGTSPLVINKFGKSSREAYRAKQVEGKQKGSAKKTREGKDFDKLYKECQRVSATGWHGFCAAGLRNAMVRACSLTGVKMTHAKMAFRVRADGFDADDNQPLVRIAKAKPEKVEHVVRNDTGVIDIRPRAMFQKGWEATARVQYDADMFEADDIINLIQRAGMQVGLHEGRNSSPNSNGCGWGSFSIVGKDGKTVEDDTDE
jgi:hypothetical protein